MEHQNKKHMAFFVSLLILLPVVSFAESDKKDAWKTHTISSQTEIDTTYVESFKKQFANYDNPYKVIDTDYHNKKINKATWQASWNFIQENKNFASKKEDIGKKEKSEKKESDSFLNEKQKLTQKQQEISKYKEQYRSIIEAKVSGLSDAQLERVAKNIKNAIHTIEKTKTSSDKKEKLLYQLLALEQLLQEQREKLIPDEIDIDALFRLE